MNSRAMGEMVRVFWISCVVALCVAVSADAQGVNGVGRLETTNEGAFCSGALVAPNLVLTAAHCVAKYEGQPLDVVEGFGFRPGQLRGAPLVEARKIVLHPLYRRALNNLQRLRFDLALVELAEPVDDRVSTPLMQGDEAERGEQLFIVSWRNSDGGTPRQKRCGVQNGHPGLVTLDCEVFGGESGSPVLRLVDGSLELVAVVSSRSEIGSRPSAQASNIATRLPALLQEFQRARGDAGS